MPLRGEMRRLVKQVRSVLGSLAYHYADFGLLFAPVQSVVRSCPVGQNGSEVAAGSRITALV